MVLGIVFGTTATRHVVDGPKDAYTVLVTAAGAAIREQPISLSAGEIAHFRREGIIVKRRRVGRHAGHDKAALDLTCTDSGGLRSSGNGSFI